MVAATPNENRENRPVGQPRAGRHARRTLWSDLERLRSQLTAAIEARPLTAAATAVGIGFVLGGGLTRPTIGLLIQTGSRVAANFLGEVMRSHTDAGAEETRA
jgi:surfactin synthase thioesterase subunit